MSDIETRTAELWPRKLSKPELDTRADDLITDLGKNFAEGTTNASQTIRKTNPDGTIVVTTIEYNNDGKAIKNATVEEAQYDRSARFLTSAEKAIVTRGRMNSEIIFSPSGRKGLSTDVFHGTAAADAKAKALFKRAGKLLKP